MTRQRETLRCVSPTRWYSPFSSTRSSFACSSSGNSPISSSSRVPSWASSKYPALLEAAPVNAPLTYPNRVGSTSVGEIAAQLRVRYGRPERGESWCRLRATSSLPLPDSPSISTGYGEPANCAIWLFSLASAGLSPTRSASSPAGASRARASSRLSSAGSLGFATNSQAPSARAWRALAASFCPESTKIFMRGECASRSAISWKPSSGACGVGGSPRSTRASGGGSSSWRRSSIALVREPQACTSKSAPSANDSASVISASSSTTSNPGLASGAGCGLLVTDASHEGALQVGLAVARTQGLRRAAEAQPRALEHRDRGAEFVHVGEHVRSEEQGATLRAQALQYRFHRHPRGGVKAAHRLIEHVELTLERKTAGESELLRHTLGEAAHRPRQRVALELELGGEARGACFVV